MQVLIPLIPQLKSGGVDDPHGFEDNILHLCTVLSAEKVRHYLLVGVVSVAIRHQWRLWFVMIQGSTLGCGLAISAPRTRNGSRKISAVSSLLSSVHLYQRAFFLLKGEAYSQPSTCLCTVCVLSIMIFLSLLIVLQCIYQSTWKFNAVHLLFSWNNISEFLCS